MAVRAWSWLLVAGCGFRAGGGTASIDAADSPGTVADAPVDMPSIDGTRTDWWDPAWRHRIKVTIDNTKIPGAVDDFPVFVTLPAPVDASSLRFVSDDNTRVYLHEIDMIPSGGGVLAWVKIPMIVTTGAKPTFWAYYDNPTATPTGNGPAVWNARHTSVHHLGASLEDSTGGHHTGTANGNPTVVPGALGFARSFDGNDYIELAGEGSYDYATEMYVSAWVKVDMFDAPYQAIVTKGDSSWRLARGDQTNGAGFGTTSGTVNHNTNGSKSLADGKWHHVAGVLDGTTKTLYVDGVADEAASYTLQLDNNQALVRLGMNPESNVGGPRYWKGTIDELRTSAGQRSANWIKAEFVNGDDPAFIKTGAPEPY